MQTMSYSNAIDNFSNKRVQILLSKFHVLFLYFENDSTNEWTIIGKINFYRVQ